MIQIYQNSKGIQFVCHDGQVYIDDGKLRKSVISPVQYLDMIARGLLVYRGRLVARSYHMFKFAVAIGIIK